MFPIKESKSKPCASTTCLVNFASFDNHNLCYNCRNCPATRINSESTELRCSVCRLWSTAQWIRWLRLAKKRASDRRTRMGKKAKKDKKRPHSISPSPVIVESSSQHHPRQRRRHESQHSSRPHDGARHGTADTPADAPAHTDATASTSASAHTPRSRLQPPTGASPPSSIGTPTHALVLEDPTQPTGDKDGEVYTVPDTAPPPCKQPERTQRTQSDVHPSTDLHQRTHSSRRKKDTSKTSTPLPLVDRSLDDLLDTPEDVEQQIERPLSYSTERPPHPLHPPHQSTDLVVVTEAVPVVTNMQEILQQLRKDQAKQMQQQFEMLMSMHPQMAVSKAVTTTTTTTTSTSATSATSATTATTTTSSSTAQKRTHATTAVSFASGTRMTTYVSGPQLPTREQGQPYGPILPGRKEVDRIEDTGRSSKRTSWSSSSSSPSTSSSSSSSSPSPPPKRGRERERKRRKDDVTHRRDDTHDDDTRTEGRREPSRPSTQAHAHTHEPTTHRREDSHRREDTHRREERDRRDYTHRSEDAHRPVSTDPGRPESTHTRLHSRPKSTPKVASPEHLEKNRDSRPSEQFVTDPRFDKHGVDEEMIIKFFYKNTYVVEDILRFYNTKEERIPYLKDLKTDKRPHLVRVHEAVLDFSDCPEDMWKPALLRFEHFVNEGFADHKFSDAESRSPTREDSREKTKRRAHSEESEAETTDPLQEDVVEPAKSDAILLKATVKILIDWDRKLRVVASADAEAKRVKPLSPDKRHDHRDDSEDPGPPPEPGTKACLPPHSRVGRWYRFTQDQLNTAKTSKPGTAVHLEVSKKAAKLFSTGSKHKYLIQERSFPGRFEKISSMTDETKVQKIRTQPLSLSTPIVKATEAIIRTGITAQSYEMQFITALQKKITQLVDNADLIKTTARDTSLSLLKAVNKMDNLASNLARVLREAKDVVDATYMTADCNLAAWVSLDYNFTLVQRDRLTAKLLDHMKFAAAALRRSSLESAELFPNIEELIMSSDKELSSRSQLAMCDFIVQSKKDKGKGQGRRPSSYSTNKTSKSFVPRQNKGRGRGRGSFRDFRDNDSNTTPGRGRGRGRGRGSYRTPSSDKSKSK